MNITVADRMPSQIKSIRHLMDFRYTHASTTNSQHDILRSLNFVRLAPTIIVVLLGCHGGRSQAETRRITKRLSLATVLRAECLPHEPFAFVAMINTLRLDATVQATFLRCVRYSKESINC